MGRKLFCELGPTAYKISLYKGIILKDISDIFKATRFAKEKKNEPLPNIVKDHASLIVRNLHGVDLELQQNKETNLRLASAKINGVVIHPGEVFSFWNLIGMPKISTGYKEGLTISSRHGFGRGVGGGLCQLANMVHWLVLHSPLEVVEKHHHSDALFPDEKRKVPFGTGTSVFYKRLDYRFRNNTDQDVQIRLWIKDGYLCGELCSEKPFPCKYKIVEEDHHFHKEDDGFYRISRIYKISVNRETGETNKELILNNHSKVMYDYSLIPEDEIR